VPEQISGVLTLGPADTTTTDVRRSRDLGLAVLMTVALEISRTLRL